MKIRIIDKALGLSGQNLEFVNEDFFGLKVGTFITQIGNGKNNGTIRTDTFAYPLEYVGAILCEFKEKEKMFAFKLPSKVSNEDVFLLYGSTGLQIFTEHTFSSKDRLTTKRTSYLRVYEPIFKAIK